MKKALLFALAMVLLVACGGADAGTTAPDPILIAFGNKTYDILQKNLRDEFQIFKVTHYSHYISKEKYREHILESLKTLQLEGGN